MLIAFLIKEKEYTLINTDEKELSDRKIKNSSLVSLSYLRKVNLEAYSYLILLDEIMICRK